MKLFKLALCSIAAASVLVGCANYHHDVVEKTPYVSDARVIGSFFGYGRIRDTEVPKDQYFASENFLWNVIGNTSALSVPNVGMGGVHGWDGLGVGLGLAILQSALAPEAYENLPGAFGYVPVKYAKTPQEARDWWIKSMRESFIAAVKRMGGGWKVEPSKVMKTSIFGDNGRFQILVLENPKMGCPTFKSVDNDWLKTCRASLFAFDPYLGEPVKIPAFAAGDKVVNAWEISNTYSYKEEKSVNLNWIFPKDAKFDRDLFSAHWSKTLPKYAYVYSEPHENLRGQKVPPYIIERNKTHFWVVPKKN